MTVLERPPGTESRVLRAKLELALPGLLAVGRRLFSHPAARELYPEYLFVSHCVIRASVPLMERALERARLLSRDPVAAALADYLEGHIGEERGHDEWLLGDLEALGSARAAVLGRPPSPDVASLVGAQYYWIEHYHPVALLGYVVLLEGYPPRDREIDGLQARTGYPAEAFRTLRAHADLDPEHGRELDALVDALPLTPPLRTVLGLSAIASTQGLTRALEAVVAGGARGAPRLDG